MRYFNERYKGDICIPKGRYVSVPKVGNKISTFYEINMIPPHLANKFNHDEIPESLLKSYTNPDPLPTTEGLAIKPLVKRDLHLEQRSWNLVILRHRSYSLEMSDFRVVWNRVFAHADYYKIALALYLSFDIWGEAVKPTVMVWGEDSKGWGTPWKNPNGENEALKLGILKYKKFLNTNRFFLTPDGWWYRLPSWIYG